MFIAAAFSPAPARPSLPMFGLVLTRRPRRSQRLRPCSSFNSETQRASPISSMCPPSGHSAYRSVARRPGSAWGKPRLPPARLASRERRARDALDDGVVVTGPGDDARMNYAARVLLFPNRATFAFLADFVATDPVSVSAA